MVFGKRFSWMQRNKFFETTPLFGFSLINSAKNKYEVVLWYILIIVCATLTIRNLSFLVKQYSSGETVTSMKTGRSHLALFPNMTFCVQMRLPEVNREYRSRRKKNLSLLANVPALRDEVDVAIQNFAEKRDVLKGPWNYIVLPLLFRYFTSMRLLEVDPGFLNPGASSTVSGRVLRTFLKRNSSFYSTFSRAVFSILNRTRSLGVDDYELFERFSQELVTFSQFKARYSERTMISAKTWTLKPQIKVLFFKLSKNIVHGFCFGYESLERMSADHHQPQNVEQRIDFEISCKTRDKILQQNYGFNMNQLSAALGIGGKLEERNLEKLEVILGDEFGAKEFIDFPSLTADISTTVRAHVTTKVVSKSIVNCSPTTTKDQCIIQCKTEIITRSCDCSPLLLLKTMNKNERNETKEMCRLENYLNCLKPSLVDEYNHCIENCASACFHVKYSLTPHRIRTYGNYPKANVYIYRKESEYPIFVENYAQSLESFLGELGGILGFYLGASILTVVHLLIFIMKLMLPNPNKSKNHETDKEKTNGLEFQSEKRNGSAYCENVNQTDNQNLLSANLAQRVTNIENLIKDELSSRILYVNPKESSL